MATLSQAGLLDPYQSSAAGNQVTSAPGSALTAGAQSDPAFLDLNKQAWAARNARDAALAAGNQDEAAKQDAIYQQLTSQITAQYGPIGTKAPTGQLTTQLPTIAGTAFGNAQASGGQSAAAQLAAAGRVTNVANQIGANANPQPQVSAAQSTQAYNAAGGVPNRTPLAGTIPTDQLQQAGQQLTNNGATPAAPRGQSPQVQQQVSQITNAANSIPAATVGTTPNYSAIGQAAAGRAAPQITGDTGQAAQQQSLSAAQAFKPDTSGIAAISGAKADTSGAQTLNAFNPTNTTNAASALQNLQQPGAQQAVAGLKGFNPNNPGVGALQGFSADKSGQANLNQFAAQAPPPSVAQQLLQSGSDANIRQALALARSARGGPAAVAQAQRVAQSENAATQAQTSGQSAALAAQETATNRQEQLQALQGAGTLGVQTGAQQLAALQSSGQLISDQNAQQLQSLQAQGQILSAADAQKLSAYQSAAQTFAAADAQRLSAQTSAANINLQGSQINQQGAIAAQAAQATASGQQIQALSLQGQISDQIRTANVDELKANLSASLQQLNLNDTQVRQMAQIQEDARQANQNAQLSATQLGVSSAAAASAVDLAWQQFAFSQLTQEQQIGLQNNAQQQQQAQFNAQMAQQQGQYDTNMILGAAGAGVSALSKLGGSGSSSVAGPSQLAGNPYGTPYSSDGLNNPATSDERAKKNIRPVKGREVAQALRDSPGSEYEYKEPDKPGRAPGKHQTPMAQGLQKSKLFSPAVQPDEDGTLMVDATRLVLSHHTALSHLQKEIDLIKKHRKARAHG